ncbi:MepB domain containing protein [Pedobacter sp. KBW06]|uniref:MepB family protein n=1 Tax=Pedobacter sp. KBW06 TaxID=2153359 RepID=UPI000F594A70|nr:MepB family protein [Pedobacter sp. KBW06]RQO75779.1 MepB domain containing protein [Pedobacter sp. KBW06]
MALPADLLILKELVFDPLGFESGDVVPEAESMEYGACSLALNGLALRFRTAKITPTKTGQFVTLWKRKGSGPIEPYQSSDELDLFLVTTRKGERFGHFVFPKSALIKQGILSNNGKEGKRAIRVYPPWDVTRNKQAQKTQQWQLEFFIEISPGQELDPGFVNRLYGYKKEALL